MLNTHKGRIVGIIKGGKSDGKFVYIDDKYDEGAEEIELDEGILVPLMNLQDERGIYYVAGPSGSGKSTYAAQLAKNFMKAFPESNMFFFSRTNHEGDPALKGLKLTQIFLDEKILEHPIDIEKDIPPKSILFFDDFNSIENDKIQNYILKLIRDVMECGRRLQINALITSHLIIPDERKFARNLMNELQFITIFPKSGTVQQITYSFKTYFGLSSKQIKQILALKSRWVTLIKSYPLTILYEKGIYIL